MGAPSSSPDRHLCSASSPSSPRANPALRPRPPRPASYRRLAFAFAPLLGGNTSLCDSSVCHLFTFQFCLFPPVIFSRETVLCRPVALHAHSSRLPQALLAWLFHLPLLRREPRGGEPPSWSHSHLIHSCLHRHGEHPHCHLTDAQLELWPGNPPRVPRLALSPGSAPLQGSRTTSDPFSMRPQ